MRQKPYKFFNKKGVSPLIATVLLISFAVALGSVVLNWGRNFDISRPGDNCAGISIKIRNINDYQVCYSGSGQDQYINFIMDNKGDRDIGGLGIWITGEKGTKLLDFNELSIKTGELLDIKDKSVKYDYGTYGAIKNIQFFPKVKVDNDLEICARKSIKSDNIGAC
jgi:flagellin-like protein|tara:strand:- start:224 stop:721 length:498 start_codon:yes stop_codon:yes gene_type:complete